MEKLFMIRNSMWNFLVLANTDPVRKYNMHIAAEAINDCVVNVTDIVDTRVLPAMNIV